MAARALLLAALLIGPWTGVWADDGGSSAPVVVARVLPGGILELSDGRLLRLAGIRMPAADGLPALARQARAALAGLVEDRQLRLDPAGLTHDRHGRLVGQAWRDGLWLQGALLDEGLAQVQTRPGEVALAAEMAAREQAARAARRGIWADFAPRRADQVDQAAGFQIVQGRVVRVAPTERFIYLNFGVDWRTDFTLRVARGAARSFRRAGIDLESLAGREVEARGYVLEAGGPLIELSHPEQLRMLR